MAQKKYLINYANDDYKEAQRINTYSAKKYCCFDEIIEYTPVDIDGKYKTEHDDIFSIKRGDGLWLWKPYVIRKTLQKMEKGDILVYVDSGTCFFRNCNCIFDILEKQDIWVTYLPLIEKQWTKKKAFEILGVDADTFGDENQISGTFVALKKSVTTVRFVDEWLKYCENYECISPSENKSKEISCFISHREDQSILSLLIKKYGINSFSDPTQFGVYQNGYSGKNRIMKFVDKSDYKPFILHHRRKKPSIFDLFKCWIRIYLPVKIQIILDWRKQV